MNGLLVSKTFWTGIGSISTGLGIIMSGDYPNGISMIAMGLIAIFGRNALAKIQHNTTNDSTRDPPHSAAAT